MRQYKFWQALYLSFYSKELYKDVKQQWGANTLLYLLLILAFCWLILLLRIQPSINDISERFFNKVVPQLPEEIQIQKGVLKTSKNIPYVIYAPDKKEIIAIIDTSGKYKSLHQAKAGLLITKDTLIYSDYDRSERKQLLPHTLNVDLKIKSAHERLAGFINWLWLIIWPVAVVLSFFYRLVQILILALLGKLISLILRVQLSYAQLIKLTIVALTPSMVLGTIFNLFGVWFMHQSLAFFLLAIGYLVFAIRANRVNQIQK